VNHYKAIQLLAMESVTESDSDYNLRFIFRWYSRAFNTPLHEVEELPLDDILVAFFETRFEEMGDEEREKEIASLLESPEARKERLKQEAREDAETADFMRFTETQASLAARNKKATLPDKKAAAYPADLVPPPGVTGPERLPGSGETTLKDYKSLPPDINMTFVEPDEFEKLLESREVPEDGEDS
jgi:hypothetical protein